MIRVYYENKRYKNQIEYVFKVIGNCCGNKVKFVENLCNLNEESPEVTLNICYGKTATKIEGIHIFEGQLFDNNIYLTERSIPKCPVYRYKGLPIFYISSIRENDVEIMPKQINLRLDIVQSIFYILTNYEEVVQNEPSFYDQHGRFKAEYRILYKEKYFDKPLINEYVKLICDLGRKISIDELWKVPKTMSIHVTHDVDYPYEITLGDRIQTALFNRILGLPAKRKLNCGCEIIDTVEKNNGIISSWYFKGGGTSKYDDRYKLNNDFILQFVSNLRNRGCEIGYHYSYYASTNQELALKECQYVKNVLKLDDLCGRNHYLRYTLPMSWHIYEKLNIIYDTTQGCADCEGFLRGICIPYKLFDLQEGRELKVWEIPLTVMDGTLRGEAYRNYNKEDAQKRIFELIQTASEYSGVFSILWHNTSIMGKYWQEWFEDVYVSTMKYISTFDGCCMKGIDIIKKYNIND